MASGAQSFLKVTVGSGLLILGIAGAPAKAAQVTLTYMGDTTNGQKWDRPVENGNSPPNSISNLFGTAVPFSSQPFYTDTTGSYNFLSTSTWNNYTFLYQDSFNPNQQLTNVFIGNDTYQGSSPIPSGSNASGFDNVTLTVNRQYFFVTTGNDNTNFGTFSNTITGPSGSTISKGISPAAVPFEFSPGLGLSILGAWFGVSRLRNKISKRKSSQGSQQKETSEAEELKAGNNS